MDEIKECLVNFDPKIKMPSRFSTMVFLIVVPIVLTVGRVVYVSQKVLRESQGHSKLVVGTNGDQQLPRSKDGINNYT